MNKETQDRPKGAETLQERLARAREAIERISEPVAVDAGAVLRRRARELAARPPQEDDAARRLDVVEFIVAQEHYCLSAEAVIEVYPLAQLTPVPCVPDFVRGIINVRGRIVSVIDIRRLFDLPDGGAKNPDKVIIIRSGAMEMGILADSVPGLGSIAVARMQGDLPTLDGMRAEYLLGVTPDHRIVLDAERLLSDERLLVSQEK